MSVRERPPGLGPVRRRPGYRRLRGDPDARAERAGDAAGEPGEQQQAAKLLGVSEVNFSGLGEQSLRDDCHPHDPTGGPTADREDPLPV
jgi:hypothetical protein